MIYENLIDYANEIGGVIYLDRFEAIPFNHWRKDFEWLVLLIPDYSYKNLTYHIPAYVSVQALTARQACEKALEKYQRNTFYE